MVTRSVVPLLLFVAVWTLSAHTTINVPPECSVFFIANQGTNNARIDGTISQTGSNPFQISQSAGTSFYRYALYGVGLYISLTAYLEYLMYQLTHGRVCKLLEGKPEAEIYIADVCAQYAHNITSDHAVLDLYLQLRHELSCALYLEKLLGLIPAKLFPRYQYARTIVRRYKKSLHLVHQHMTSTDSSKKLLEAFVTM